ncbi:integral peroxisomal membrane peroxin-domain-containing protein [Dipodascopsis tothii]|uniref:integral peroxisomal membrane peroxin-domain-containing protein n=1 Tax=Dipodascopsis tothii TaxID=44089 RepID=UPI0034CF733B
MAAFETPWITQMTTPASSNSQTSGAAGAANPAVAYGPGVSQPTASVTAQPTYATFVAPESSHINQTSPLLSSTPPTITRALSLAYPYIWAADKVFGLLTWTSGDPWASFLLVVGWAAVVVHWEALVEYMGHLLAVGGLAAYVYYKDRAAREQEEHPTLDAIIAALTTLTTRADMFFAPLTNLSLTHHDLTRLLFTTMFLSPVYFVLARFLVGARGLLLLAGLFVLTYHSLPARVTRTMLWRSRTVRLLSFYLTGLDFSRGGRGPPAHPSRPTETPAPGKGDQTPGTAFHTDGTTLRRAADGESVRFTYVVYENQRKWLGIGWTANLLAYERTAWTDEFLNECASTEDFTLPDAEGTGMAWKWVDPVWRVDTSSGAEDGWVYYDNTWKKPSSDDAFGRYTRRRRWIRNAELIESSETGTRPERVERVDRTPTPPGGRFSALKRRSVASAASASSGDGVSDSDDEPSSPSSAGGSSPRRSPDDEVE